MNTSLSGFCAEQEMTVGKNVHDEHPCVTQDKQLHAVACRLLHVGKFVFHVQSNTYNPMTAKLQNLRSNTSTHNHEVENCLLA